jgi:hypothetical protein
LLAHGFRFALDNGAWSAHMAGRALDTGAYERAIEKVGAAADWVVAPDIVAGGLRSLDLTSAWLPRLKCLRLVLVAVQDGMTPADVRPLMGPRVGIFLGGSTAWKLGTMQQWGDWASTLGVYFHVGRVNTARRIRMAMRAGADSIDGTSVSRYVVNLPRLAAASSQPTLLGPHGAPHVVRGRE